MAMTVAVRPPHDTLVAFRMPAATKELIERAAASVNKSFNAFVVESAREQALAVLLNQTVFNLSPEEAEAFAAVLDNPPAPTEKLKALMKSKAPQE